ncbi:YkyA family protein [Oceanobacillus chungangensis]|uniref:Cell-wall binding lipoprotein n=1 Tax=Oceanobacillus chungangensis TaxID=1229152 RepID=A0A3D8PNL5_9BACI|nr:YkyA family protein [Oceanobacillus chungangensis]RDW17706.1 hypothetical protein CWR45_10220 [Oceanobacillus chungangensis]
MKRLLAFAVVVSIIFLLTGCPTNEKRAAKIQEKIEESATFENDFVDNQTKLYEVRGKAQQVYDDLIDLSINDADMISQKLDEAATYKEEQEKLLKQSEENFQKAYDKFSKIEKNAQKIKDENQKDVALELITLMNNRKELIDTFFEKYRDYLELQSTFYGYIEKEEYRFDSLDKQIKDVNESSKEIGEVIQQFNVYTEQYSNKRDDYYQMN